MKLKFPRSLPHIGTQTGLIAAVPPDRGTLAVQRFAMPSTGWDRV